MRAACRRCEHHLELARSGQCPFCVGTTTITVESDAIEQGTGPTVEIECDTCFFRVSSRIVFALLREPRVRTALSNRGLAPEQYEWELPALPTRVVSQDPLRIQIDIRGEEDTTAIVVDRDLSLCSVDTEQ